MKSLIEKGKAALTQTTDKVVEELLSGKKIIENAVGKLPIISSIEKLKTANQKYDEKHYFIVPNKLSETGFTLHTMRSLPDNVPEVNNLPKRRVFHFANEHHEAALREAMCQSAKDIAKENTRNEKSSLEKLADDIDKLDSKLTYGMLLIGGIAAIFNPLVGAGIAAKALLPSISGLLVKYGLRTVGEKLTQSSLEKEVKKAEEKVLQQFTEANTLKITNPILQELELALNTTAKEHDPLRDSNPSLGKLPELDGEGWRELTEQAIYHVYRDIYKNKKLYQAAHLGPEDIRWLNFLFENLQK